MKRISYYYLYYTPRGKGRVLFRLQGSDKDYSTEPLDPSEFAALAAVLAQKNLSYDEVQKTFASFDDDDAQNPLAKSLTFS